MHRKHGHADVDGFDIVFGDVFRNGSATAEVHPAEFRGLPDYAVFVEKFSDVSYEFARRVVAARFAACAGELAHCDALIHKTCVVVFKAGCEVGIVACGDVRRKAKRVFAKYRRQYAEVFGDFVQNVGDNHALHARRAFRADFFLVGKDRHNRSVGCGVEGCGDFGISANSVVVTVSRDERPVETDVASLQSRYDFEFRRQKVFLAHFVLFHKD